MAHKVEEIEHDLHFFAFRYLVVELVTQGSSPSDNAMG
jgi:hypothetical protein